MTFPVTDANSQTQQLLTGVELQAAFATIVTAVNALAPLLDGVEGPLGTVATDSTLAAVRDRLPVSLGPKAQSTSLSIVPATGLALATDTVASLMTPADDAIAITPSDTTNLAQVPKSLLVTAAGTVAIQGASGVTISLGQYAVGQTIPIRARRVMSTGTSATVVGLV